MENAAGGAPPTAEPAYREVYAVNAAEAGKQLVRSYEQLGNISAAARLRRTSRQVVRQGAAAFGVYGG